MKIKSKKWIEREKLKEWRRQVLLRDKGMCQKCHKDLSEKRKNIHHIISLQAVKRKYPKLLVDPNNGILLCAFCHKYAPDSPHQGGFEFTSFLMKEKSKQYKYLMKRI